MLYGYTTKNINRAMKRNIERFPEDFCFRLTEKESENLRLHFGTSSLEKETATEMIIDFEKVRKCQFLLKMY